MHPPPNARILLRANGVALVLDVSEGRLPTVEHWGADIALEPADLEALALSGLPPAGVSPVERPVRIALVPEHWAGWMGTPGITGSRADGSAWSPRFRVRRLAVDDRDVEGSEHSTFVSSASGSAVVEAFDLDAQLELRLDIELLPSGLLRIRATITNTAPDAYRLDRLVLALPVPRVADEILDFAGRGTDERIPQRRRVQTGVHLRENRRGHTGHDSATVLHVGTPGFGFAAGELWSVHVAWSGNHVHFVERLSTGEQVVGGGELLLPGEVVLDQDESYASPWLYANHGDGLDAVARRFHQHLRHRPTHPTSPRPVTLNVWEAVYYRHDLPVMADLADRAAALGIERYVLDDGWFSDRRHDRAGLGDWAVSPEVWPGGLRPLIDHVHDLGMQFGLWFEPEMINADSDLARLHPEWIMQTGGRLPLESRHQQVLNLGIPECYSDIRRQMFEVLDTYPVDYIKWDHNRQLVDAGTFSSGRAGVHEQTLAFYRLVDEIKERYPSMEIESCAGGGARIDLEVLDRVDRVWVSDCSDPLERQSMHRWTTQLVPPELMGAHIASSTSHITGRHHDLSFRAATAVFGHLGIEWDLREATPEEMDELAVWIEFYKAHRRELHGGHLVRLDHPDETVLLHGVIAPDASTAIYSHAAGARSRSGHPGRIRLPGLEPERRYRVTPVPLGWQPEASEAPPWWGLTHGRSYDHATGVRPGPRWRPVRGSTGIVSTGRLLGTVGLAAAGLAAEHAVLYLVEALGDQPGAERDA
ncbi:alpha-galactosidase [uncultured Amnibacterium sp.]|uniref:alpha-galactosidase n=1 Tax=uncultured Amnibacterium sp. TaxID=1631851 RepID=UPI0035CB6F19